MNPADPLPWPNWEPPVFMMFALEAAMLNTELYVSTPEITVGEVKVQLLVWSFSFKWPFSYFHIYVTVLTRKTRILDVVYNASNNELVRTKTLVKNSIVQIDATPFRQWYEQHYGIKVGVKKSKKTADEVVEKKSNSVTKKLTERQKTRTLDPALDDAFASGRLLACIASRPGQSGRCDGYILEGKELDFYAKALKRRKQ